MQNYRTLEKILRKTWHLGLGKESLDLTLRQAKLGTLQHGNQDPGAKIKFRVSPLSLTASSSWPGS
jgi:hypothetical protein